MPAPEEQRPLLIQGELLRQSVKRIRTGGGNKFHPYSPEQARERIAPQAATVRGALQGLPDDLRGPRLFFQATLLPNYLAASYFPDQLLRRLDVVPIGSRPARAPHITEAKERTDTLTKSLILSATDTSLDALVELIESGGDTRLTKRAAEQLREVEEIRVASPEEILGRQNVERKDSLTEYEAVLHPGPQSRSGRLAKIDDDTFSKWVDLVGRLDGEVAVDHRHAVGGLTFVPVRLTHEATLAAAQFNPLRSLRPLPEMRPITPTVLRSTSHIISPPADATPETNVQVAIFDGGTSTSDIFPTCTVIDVVDQMPEPEYLQHGSGVTGAVLYGNVDPVTLLPKPSSAVRHYQIVPDSTDGFDPEIYQVLDQIVEVVEKGDIDIVNLSLGPYISVEDSEEPNRWTSTLDDLAYEYDVLFVVAAGNNGKNDSELGLNRIQVPADMVNGLSVGACDCHHPGYPWDRIDYSAVGPGRSGSRIQPVGVQFGGTEDGDMFYTLMPDGSLCETNGTSFAAPLVTNSLCKLGGLLGAKRATLNNFRAFAVHFAEPHEKADEKIMEVGHGRFEHDYTQVLRLGSNECTVLYEDSIYRDEVVSLPLPVPTGIIGGMIEISWTIALTSPIEPSQPLEYTQASIELTFRPHKNKFKMRKEGRSKTVDITDEELIAQYFVEGYTLSSVPVSLSISGSYRTESERRSAGKWETLKHFRKHFRTSSLANPQLELSYLARIGGLLTQNAPPIDYTLIVSVKVPKDSNLYNRVVEQFPVLAPLEIATPLQVRPGV